MQINKSNWFADKLSIYQSANSGNESIKKNFVIRQAEFDIIISELKNKSDKDPLQHELVLGRRGSGKSTLLRRIQSEIDENKQLQKKYIAINLAEEQAGIYRLFDLWEEVLKEIIVKFNFTLNLKNYDDYKDDQDYTRYLYDTIHASLAKVKKRIVLLLDNFDRIAGNFTDDGNLLRELLLNHNDIQIIAGSTRMDENFWQYDKPFYGFFRQHRLEALSTKEIFELLNHWGNALELPQLAQFVKENAGKIESIRILTDGQPRTLQFFIQALMHNANLFGYQYLRKVMDNVSSLYQERLNNLPAAQRKIIVEMAFLWEACGTKELVEKCRMESKLISAQIKQLSNAGIIDTIATDKKNHLYRISERFFNLWLIMTQGNPEQKNKAEWLSTFLETWYDAQEIKILPGDNTANLKNKKIGYDKAMLFKTADTVQKDFTVKNALQYPDLSIVSEPEAPIYKVLNAREKFGAIGEEIIQLIDKKEYGKAERKALEIKYEQGGFKFFMLALISEEQSKLTEAENFYVKAIEKGNTLSLNNLAVLYEKNGLLAESERYYMMAVDKDIDKSFINLATFYYLNNVKRTTALELISAYNLKVKNDLKGMQFQMLIEIWNGIFDGLHDKIQLLLQHNGCENAEMFLTNLLFQEQQYLVLGLFANKQYGEELQKRYKPLYYAVLILNNKTANNLILRIPPEIMQTLNEIIGMVRNKQVFYAAVTSDEL